MNDPWTFPQPTRSKALAFAALLLSACAPAAPAANTWDGGAADDSWGSATNWDTDVVPSFPAALTFAGSTRLTPSNDLDGLTVTGITFSAGAGAFNLVGNPIALSGNIGVTVGGSVTNDQTVGLPMTLGSNVTLSSGNSGGSTASGKGVLVLNGKISGPYGVTTGGRNYVQFNAPNTYTGDTLITSTGSDPSISIGCDNPFGTGLVKFGATVGSAQQWIIASGADRTITNSVDINTVLFITHDATVAGKASANLILAGPVLVHSQSGFYGNKSVTLSGPVSGGSSAANNFELRSGKLSLWGNNSFTNTIIITNPGYGYARVLNINSDASLGHTNNSVRLFTSATFQVPSSTAVTLAPSRAISVTNNLTATFDIPSGSTLTMNGPVTNRGAVAKTSAGTLALNGANTYGGGTTLWGGTLSINDDSGLGSVPASPANNLAFGAAATLKAGASHALAANRTVFIGTNAVATFDTQSYTQTVSGVLAGAQGSWLVKSGAGTLGLDPGAGRTNSVSSLRAQAGTLALLSGTHLVTSNTVATLYPVYDIFYMNGGNVLVGGGTLMTTGDGYATIQNGSLTVTNGTVDLNSLRELLNAYSGTGNTTVSGSGVLDLQTLRVTQSGTPGVSNVVNVNAGGTIRLKNFSIDTGFSTPYGTVNLNGGTLVAKATTDGFMGYNTGKWTTNVFFYVLGGGAVIDSGTNAVMSQLPLYSGAPNDGGLTKKGSGVFTLANTNTYTGLTTVEAGTLRLNVSNTLWTGGSVLVGSNGVFDVNGKVQALTGLGGSGLVTNNSLLSVTAAVAPGGTNAIGQLTLASTPAGLVGALAVDVATNSVCDRLQVQGNLDLAGLTLSLANPGSLEKRSQYVIAACTGTLTGPFQSAPLPQRWHLTYLAREVRLCYNFGSLIAIK